VFLPTSTADVETAVAIFYHHDCPFSVRGGGHSAIRGAANIDDGILMSMRQIRDVTISKDRSSVVVGAGLTFGEIYTAVEREDLIIVGGRFGTVGTGLLVGAGFSYFNNRYGLAVDNVKRQIVVLANGTAVNASSVENTELHWALKGGSNNFGVVTHFDLFTIETKGVFGGRITYPESSIAALEDATYNYHTKVAVEDIDVHVLPTYVYDSVTNTTFGATPVVANANVTELPTSLSEWQQIEHSNSTLRNTRYGTLANELVAGFPNGLV
jgi:FAD/FMN-containing dehydrogenase